MLFTWDWKNSCVVYKWWHVKTVYGFVGTLIVLVLLSMSFELTRSWITQWKSRRLLSSYTPTSPTPSGRISKSLKIKLAAMYAFQTGFSFMLMLVFMTYNGWYMLAVVAGAGIGYFLWGDECESKSLVCH